MSVFDGIVACCEIQHYFTILLVILYRIWYWTAHLTSESNVYIMMSKILCQKAGFYHGRLHQLFGTWKLEHKDFCVIKFLQILLEKISSIYLMATTICWAKFEKEDDWNETYLICLGRSCLGKTSQVCNTDPGDF